MNLCLWFGRIIFIYFIFELIFIYAWLGGFIFIYFIFRGEGGPSEARKPEAPKHCAAARIILPECLSDLD